MNNILIGTENKEEYNKIAEEVVRKQKIREVRFLGVVKRLDRIKIKEEKMKELYQIGQLLKGSI